MQTLSLLRAGQLYLSRLEEAGYNFDVSQGFEGVAKLANEAGRNFQMPTFDVQRVDHTRRSAFWAFLYHEGQPVATAAAILQDIGDERYSEFAKRTAAAQFTNGEGAAIDWVAPLLDQELRGCLAYIGELNVPPERRGRRPVLRDFMRLVQVLVLMDWPVSYNYAFIPDRHIQAGLGSLYGFMRSLPAAQRWREGVTDKRNSSEWFVGSRREELFHVFASDLRRADVL